MLPTPVMPADVLVQLFWADTGALYRITLDGHYRVTLPGQAEEEQRPLNRFERGRDALSPTSLVRVRSGARSDHSIRVVIQQ